MSSAHPSFAFVSCCILLLCSSTIAQSPLNESYTWRPTSDAHLASLGYTEVLGTLQPLTAGIYTPTALTDSTTQTQWGSPPTITASISVTPAADHGCTIFIGPSVQLFYFASANATAATNTACLTAPQSTALPPEYSNFISPSVYILAPAISAGNAHRQVGDVHTSVIFSLAPGQLSTIEGRDGATNAYNFADLPCPPSDVASRDSWFYNPSYNPNRPYEPRISIPATVTDLDPAWSTCTATAQYQGFDPAIGLSPGNDMSGPGAAGPPRRVRRGAAHPLHAPAYANRPASTTMPLTALPTATMANDLDIESPEPPGRIRRAAQPPKIPPHAFPAASLVNSPDFGPGDSTPPGSLASATTVNGPGSGPVGPARKLRRAVGQDHKEPERPEENFQPTKTFVS